MIDLGLIPVQLGRFWSRVTAWAGGLAFCEPDASTPANLYACPLPAAGLRLTPAASLVIQPSSPIEPEIPGVRTVVLVRFVGRTQVEAFTLAGNFNKCFFPVGRPEPLFEAGVPTAGLIGLADDAAVGDIAWRMLDILPLQSPQLVASTGVNQHTADGYAAVELPLEIRALTHTLRAEEV